MQNEVFDGQHNMVLGMTQSGKTTMVIERLKRSRYPVFFFNTQEVDTPFVQVNAQYDADDFIRAMRQGDKLDYIPNRSLNSTRKELDVIIDELFKASGIGGKPFYFAIDECHVVAREGTRPEYIEQVATRGYKWGFRGIFISQKPALVSKVLISQSNRHFIFHTEWEKQYFTQKGLDFERVQQLLGIDQYNYVIYERGQFTGPFKEQI